MENYHPRNDYIRLFIKSTILALVYLGLTSGVATLAPHIAEENIYWQYFIAIALFYQSLSLLFELWLVSNGAWVYSKLGDKAKQMYPTISDFAIATNNEFTSLIHSTVSGLSALMILCVIPQIHQDHLYGSSFYSSLHSVHSSALFFAEFFDLLISPRKIGTFDAVILIHHTLASSGFFTGSFGIGTFYSTCILLSEISTMFLDLRWFLLRFDMQNLCKVAEILFVSCFLCIRVGFNVFYLTPIVFQDLFPIALGSPVDPSRFPLFDAGSASMTYIRGVAIMVCLLLCVFHLLNSFFLVQIYGLVKKSFSGKNAPSPHRGSVDRDASKPLMGDHNHDNDDGSELRS